ncbi:MAG: NTP/NDP exchange transporter [Lysobacterales bacterium]
MSASPAEEPARLPLIGATRDELPALFWSFLYFFCVLAAYYVIRPVREQFGAAAGGSAALPQIWLIVFLVMLALTPVYGALVAHFPRRIFVPVVYLFFAAGMLVMAQLLGDVPPSRLLATGFYVWVSVFNLFVVAVFWSFMADIFTDQQARHLFGAIGVGGTLGAMAGPTLAYSLVHSIGLEGLLAISAMLLMLALVAAVLLGRWARRFGRRDPRLGDQVIGGGLLAGARMVFTHPFLRRMAVLFLLSDLIGTVLYALNLDLGASLFSSAADRTSFFAMLDLYVNGSQILLQLLVAPVLLTRFGPSVVLMLVAAFNALVLLGLALFSGPTWLMAALVATRAGGYGLVAPARESLYTRVGREARYKAKNFIDTTVWRGGDVAASSFLHVLKSAGASLSQIGLIGVIAALLGVWLSRNVERLPGLDTDTDSKDRA